MDLVRNIVQGHFNEMFDINTDMSELRIRICLSCPIYSKKFGGTCNGRLYLNPLTNSVSIEPKDGYIRGCGCRLPAKTRVANVHCPVNKW